MNIFIAILALGILILVHEAGHFFTARLVGMRPRRFYVGFPPALVKVERGGIEYGIGSIPLGGYVKLPGMHRPAASDVDVYFGRALQQAPGLSRRVEHVKRPLAAGELERAQTALPALESELHGVRLSPDATRAADRGIRELRDGLSPEAYWRQRPWKRIAVIAAGPVTNLLLAVVLFAVLFMLGGGEPTRTIDSLLPGAPAERIGIRPGDTILEINGTPVSPREIPDLISSSGGRPLTVEIERNGRRLELGPVRPARTEGSYRLGFVLRGEGLAGPSAVWRSVELTGLVTREIGRSLGRLVTGSGREDVSSPVGIVQGSSDALDEGTQNFLWVLGLISLSLALLNLLPLLPLDGGHIVFSLVEALRGRAVGREVYERVSAVGIALVVILFAIGLSNDIGRLGGG
ncbi:MAG: site-2 protease family protein [Actinobacteria bacterium]|nr:site-2 protease family protein [Actinomycetota bacterium]